MEKKMEKEIEKEGYAGIMWGIIYGASPNTSLALRAYRLKTLLGPLVKLRV